MSFLKKNFFLFKIEEILLILPFFSKTSTKKTPRHLDEAKFQMKKNDSSKIKNVVNEKKSYFIGLNPAR